MELEKENNQEQKSASELRFDLVSKDWVVIATGRSKRPENFAKQERRKEESNKDDCPFCHLETIGKILLEYRDKEGQWSVAVIPNKISGFFVERIESDYARS